MRRGRSVKKITKKKISKKNSKKVYKHNQKNKKNKNKKNNKKNSKKIVKNELKKVIDNLDCEKEILLDDAQLLKVIENEEEETAEVTETIQADNIEQILFKVPYVKKPLRGTPKEVQEELDGLAKKLQKRMNNATFDKIHLYMHSYLIHVVLRKFPFIKGYQTVDIYQETLIALRFKAIPNFNDNKGMSFLNFAKMCIRRHLITLLNTSKTRKKDQSMNRSIPIDSAPLTSSKKNIDPNDSRNSYSNMLADPSPNASASCASNEAYLLTKNLLHSVLSDFERIVLEEYLSNSSYVEISKNITKKVKKAHNPKSIDNALLRIRKKAIQLKKCSKTEDMPMFLKK